MADFKIDENNDDGVKKLEYVPPKDCVFFVQFGECSYGRNCRFNHPQMDALVDQRRNGNLYAFKSTRKVPCKFYLAGSCKYGTFCEFDHPLHVAMPDPRLQYNSDNLPMRVGERECFFYMRSGMCGYGAGCKFHHPELKY